VPADQGAILAGIDVARSGRDATALTLYGRAGDTLKVLDQAGDEVHEWQRGLGRALRHETLSIDLDEPPIMGVHAGQIAIDEMDRQLRRQAQRDELGADLMALGIALAEDQRVLGDLTRESWADGPQPADLEDRIAAMCAGLAADYAPKFARAEARLLAWQEGHDDAFPDDDDDDLDDGDDDDDGDDVDEDDEGWQCATVFEATTTLVLTLADVTLGYREFRVIAPLTPFERELMRRDPWDASPINCRCAVLPADIEDDGVHVTDELVEVYQQQLLAATDEDARAFLREQQARKPQYTLGRVEIWGAPV
jgi:hypothetical protein